MCFCNSKVDHARLRVNNDTEKLTNIIIEEGKIVQYNIGLSFTRDYSPLLLLLLLTFFLSLCLSLSFSLSSELCTTKKRQYTIIMRKKNTKKKQNNCTIRTHVRTSNG
jgi:hypothetical protein